MDKKIKTKWLKALRSGKYKQARDLLGFHDGRLCCIGVGACVVDKNFKPLDNVTDDAAKLLGLTQEETKALTTRNDVLKWSFKKIADYIERHL